MKYVTYEQGGAPHLGAVVDGKVVDLSGVAGANLPSDMLSLIRAGHQTWYRAQEAVGSAGNNGIPLECVRLLAPIPRPARNIFCLGRNYAEHALESTRALGQEGKLPEFPVYFTKATTAVIGPGDPIPWRPDISTQIDWEAELGVIVGVTGSDIAEEQALNAVFGYTCLNDVTARDLQNRHTQWFKGKSLDGSCPLGPWIVTADEIGDPSALDIACRVNGEVKQHSNTRNLIFGLKRILADLSRGLTLEAGDIIATGTPEGVGFARKPPEFLKPGDVVEVEIEGIGILSNRMSGIP
ncbi:MAG: fumarylacetoacetate hydrolase family protein [Dehalococcoidia bacterium]